MQQLWCDINIYSKWKVMQKSNREGLYRQSTVCVPRLSLPLCCCVLWSKVSNKQRGRFSVGEDVVLTTYRYGVDAVRLATGRESLIWLILGYGVIFANARYSGCLGDMWLQVQINSAIPSRSSTTMYDCSSRSHSTNLNKCLIFQIWFESLRPCSPFHSDVSQTSIVTVILHAGTRGSGMVSIE
jgi:hypothetical protein